METKNIELEIEEEKIEVAPAPFARMGGYYRHYPQAVPLTFYDCNNKSMPYGERKKYAPYLNGIDLPEVLTLEKKGYTVLTPCELSHLMSKLKNSKEEDQNLWYSEDHMSGLREAVGAPYWTLHSIGFIHDVYGEAPSKFRGRLVLAKIKGFDEKNNIVFPNYDDAIILTSEDTKYMDGYVQCWEQKTDSGLAIPICFGNKSKKMGKVHWRGLNAIFSPIIVGYDYPRPEHEKIVLGNPKAKLGVWTRDIKEGLPKILMLRTKMNSKQFTITKKIAKHGNQAIICIPEILKNKLKPGTLTEIKIEIIED